jgi:hypothetical protein
MFISEALISFRKAEVPDLKSVDVGVDENVLWFDISVDQARTMYFLKRRHQLTEQVEDNLAGQILRPIINHVPQRETTLRVLHQYHDVQADERAFLHGELV